ncbi:hypothetical protein ACP0HM_19655 [Escherichia coli]
MPDRSDEHIDNINVKPNGELLVRHEDKLSTKTINSRAQFIKSLLYTMYDSDVAEKSKKNTFDNPDSEISELFKAKGIKAPQMAGTVQAWLSMVDIPFIEGKIITGKSSNFPEKFQQSIFLDVTIASTKRRNSGGNMPNIIFTPA